MMHFNENALDGEASNNRLFLVVLIFYSDSLRNFADTLLTVSQI